MVSAVLRASAPETTGRRQLKGCPKTPPPAPSPKRRGGERQGFLPLSASGRGQGEGFWDSLSIDGGPLFPARTREVPPIPFDRFNQRLFERIARRPAQDRSRFVRT